MRTNKNRRIAAPDLNPVPSSLALPSRDCGAVSERMALVRYHQHSRNLLLK